MTGSAGKPPYIPTVTITPSPRPRPAPEDDGPATEAYTALDAPDDHEERPTEQIDAVLPNHEFVASAPGRTGRGSATEPPQPTRSQIMRATRTYEATVRKYRRRRIVMRLGTTVLVAVCIAVTAAAAQTQYQSWQVSKSTTLVQQRVVAPWMSFSAMVMLVAVLATALLLIALRLRPVRK